MNGHVEQHAFVPDWPEPAERLLRDDLPAAPVLPLDVFGPDWAACIRSAAEVKSAPPDYVVAALLAAAGAAIGNTRWVSPWSGRAEPPILWTMAIGAPSSNKSPGMDAILTPLKQVERDLRKGMEGDQSEWRDKSELAKLAESGWREQAKAALKDGNEPPPRPDAANPGDEPFPPRLSIADGTVERLAVIVAKQPRGTLLARDELAGWLQGMTRYAGGSTDRPFWLEAYGGRAYTVERMGRDPVQVDRLAIGVTGAIQPDRLKTLLLKSDDDGLLARFIPIWPEPVPICRPRSDLNESTIIRTFERLHTLRMLTDENDQTRPWLVTYTEPAREQLDMFRRKARAWEGEAEGLLLSYVGKLPGIAVRLSLILAFLDWAVSTDEEPYEITTEHFTRAARYVESYALPMAKRAYATASVSKRDRLARKLIQSLRTKGWSRFSSRDVLRLDIGGLNTVSDLNPVLSALEEGDVIRPVITQMSAKGGRPARLFAINPAINVVR